MGCVETIIVDDNNSISLCLFNGVKNAKEVRNSILAGKVKASVLNAENILDKFQVHAAAFKAIENMLRNKMTTRSVYSEILYCLSPTKNITDSLKKFGLSGSERSLLVCTINDNGSHLKDLETIIEGTSGKLSELSEICNKDNLIDLYKISKKELEISNILDSIVTRIASKDVM